RSAADHWASCVPSWKRYDTVSTSEVGPRGQLPLEHALCLRFAELHRDSEAFVLGKAADPDPQLAAYAFRIWIRVADPKKERFPAALLARKEEIQTQSWCMVYHQTLGEYFEGFWKEE